MNGFRQKLLLAIGVLAVFAALAFVLKSVHHPRRLTSSPPSSSNTLSVPNGSGSEISEVSDGIEKLRRKAEGGDPAAQFELGLDLEIGSGVQQDSSEAIKWFRLAAEQEEPRAQNALGGFYFYGHGIDKDLAEALKWWRKSAEHGLRSAQWSLGNCFANGQGVAKDDAEAVKWWQLAANQGDNRAQLNLGDALLHGHGVERDANQAIKWFRKSANQGNSMAEYELGFCYKEGDGVVKDYVAAVAWFRKAANHDLASAQRTMAECCINGEGTTEDFVEGYKWLLLAAGHGDESAKLTAGGMELTLSKEQVAAGQALAREFTRRRDSQLNGDNMNTDGFPVLPTATGTGFFITQDGYLISNFHVIKDARQIRLVTKLGLVVAEVIKVDAANDLALLKTKGTFSALPIISSRSVRLGSMVSTVGFPNVSLQGFSPKLAKGEIASLAGAQDDPRFFQISVPIQPGNSGGALVDELGNVIGVVSAKLDSATAVVTTGALPENVNYAVKSSLVLNLLESIPEISSKLRQPLTNNRKFEDVVNGVEESSVLILAY